MSGLDWRFPLNIDFENWICYGSNIKHSISPVTIHTQICEKKKGFVTTEIKTQIFCDCRVCYFHLQDWKQNKGGCEVSLGNIYMEPFLWTKSKGYRSSIVTQWIHLKMDLTIKIKTVDVGQLTWAICQTDNNLTKIIVD